jgi:Pyridoxamine 5'-phosphate oxidase
MASTSISPQHAAVGSSSGLEAKGATVRHEDVVEVLNQPLARELLGSAIPARLAYNGLDGFPRVVPIGFHWNGAELVVATVSYAPKVKALLANPKVALTIDTAEPPWHILLVRGTASVEIVDGVVPEYLAASRKGDPGGPVGRLRGRGRLALQADGAHRDHAGVGQADRLRDHAAQRGRAGDPGARGILLSTTTAGRS